MSTQGGKKHEAVLAESSWWGRTGYRSKPAEFVVYFLCVSGLLLWDGFGLPWVLERSTLAVHFLASILVFPVLVLPFWLSHRDKLESSAKPFLRTTGRVIEIVLVVTLVSGLYLTFFGRRGDTLGEISYWAHLLPALPLAVVTYVHAKRWSMLRVLDWLVPLVVALLLLALPAFAAQESGSLHLRGDRLYSANMDVGSVSTIDRATGKRLGEIQVGGEVRRIALGRDGKVLAATDYTGDRVVLIDLDTGKVLREDAAPARPFGVVYDARNDLFWVAAFEGHRLLAIDPEKGIVHDLGVEETPRGLALLDDGRLLVSHAMVGKVSVFDTTSLPPVLSRTIELHATQDPDEFVSQGVPRLLDDIAVSPDGTEAWLPHLLWNFDHPFQFQSTVFPSVSILALEPGNERELADRRKHLFKQINIIETGGRTRIVSNPHDAAFSADGKKVYVTLSGSEDLMVFDLSRRASVNKKKKRRARRAGKLKQGGAKVMQIFRHLPGDNPRGLVVDGAGIFVQNAMSLDLARLDTGGTGPFARVKLADARFAELVENDSVDPMLRRGKRLFHSANTDDFKTTPMAGDFWMSCHSCHVDGFTFTNGYLFRDSPRDKHADALVGHGDLGKMVAGDFTGDYLRMIRDTQGGMGHDDRDGAEDTDPEKPTAAVEAMMADLHTFVLSKGNLPLLSTWLRLDDERKTVHAGEWVNSAACAECHSDMFDQWADSLHRLMGDSNPYYKVVEEVAAQTEGEEFRKWCMGCHHPQGLLSGLSATIEKGHMFERGGASLFEALEAGEPDLDEGTGCLFCHRITKLEDARGKGAGGNASFSVNVAEREVYVFENAEVPLVKWVGSHQINAKPEVHTASYSQDFYKDPSLCATCHNEFAPGTGSVIVDTYGEWEASPFNAPDDPSKHRTCIDCHMHADPKRIGEKIPGISTDGGRVKDNVVTHQFTGANHHLVGLRNPDLERMSIELLRTAAELETSLTEAGDLNVLVRNVGAGHALPTGVADFRQLWLRITVRDAGGNEVFAVGRIDEKGVVDPNARFYQKVFGDEDGQPVGLLFWRYAKLLKDTKIPAGGYRDEVFDLPDDLAFPLKAEVELMFRIYPQWVTDAVQEHYPELPDPKAVVMNQATVTLERP